MPEGRANALNLEAPEAILHTSNELTVVTGRLLPPWMNSGLVLLSKASSSVYAGVVLLTSWQRDAALRAAREAGFAVTVYRTWFSAGGAIGSAAELERFKRNR